MQRVQSEGDAALLISFHSSPRVDALSAVPTQLAVGQHTSVSISASDPDGDGLSYSWSATCAGSWINAHSSSPLFTPTALPSPGPFLQAAPGRHARQAELLARQHLPRDAAAEHEDDGLDRRAVIRPRKAKLLLGPGRWQQRRHALPEGVGNEFADHDPKPGDAPGYPATSIRPVAASAQSGGRIAFNSWLSRRSYRPFATLKTSRGSTVAAVHRADSFLSRATS